MPTIYDLLTGAPAIKARGRHLLADFDKLKSSNQ